MLFRSWGFVPRNLIKGKAMFVWLSFDTCNRGAGGFGSVRTERLGQSLK